MAEEGAEVAVLGGGTGEVGVERGKVDVRLGP